MTEDRPSSLLPQATTSYEMNDECRLTNDGIASLSRFKIDRMHYSTFDVGRSMFDVHWFLFFDQTGRSRPKAMLV